VRDPSGRPGTALLLGTLARAARSAGAQAYLVGGAARDLLLKRVPVDVDVAVEGPANAVGKVVEALCGGAEWTCEARHGWSGTATLRGPAGERVDLAATREETYPYPGALPLVTVGVPVDRDLARRDFTVHAMAVPLDDEGTLGKILDPFGGAEDLVARTLRLLHGASLCDDPTRAFRAARYAARLGFGLDAGFGDAMRRAVECGAFARISGDRLRRALGELLSEQNRDVAIGILGRLGIPAAVVEGWTVPAVVLAEARGTAGPDDLWRSLLAPAPPELRGRIATRLNFSRALRRATGCPR
jgi:tRNA nucleotidyltransferase (CCA-adding enzyme)